MNPIKQIGRYMIPLLSVAGIKQRGGWLVRFKLRKAGYDVLLNNGRTVYFTEEEKKKYEEALDEHALIMQVWGMAKSAGLRA
jgi:hypothetical protein